MHGGHSRKLLLAEAIVLGVPVTMLSMLAVVSIFPMHERTFWPWIAVDLVMLVAAVSILAGWWLIITALLRGASALRNAHRAVWICASLGVVLVLAAFASMDLPQSPAYRPSGGLS